MLIITGTFEHVDWCWYSSSCVYKHIFVICFNIYCSGIDIREKMARQRQVLNSRLGLDVAVKIGIDMSEIFSAEDLTISLDADGSRQDATRVSVYGVVIACRVVCW